MGDVDAFDDSGGFGEGEEFLEFFQAVFWIGDESFGLPIFLVAFVCALAEGGEGFDFIAEAGG